jgi:pimeloyl-ACP methyl ester carboxylesterase
VSTEEVTYVSGGVNCAADLHVHPGAPRPGIAICHGFNMTKEALVPEAKALHDAGFNVIAIDYRSFGKSEGEPRGALFPRNQVEDLRNALTYLSLRPEVDGDRLAVWGISFGGGIAIQAGAFDRRAKAVVGVVPIVNGRRWMREIRSGDDYQKVLRTLESDFVGRYNNPDGAVRVVSAGPRSHNPAIPMARVEGVSFELDDDNPNYVAYPEHFQSTFESEILLESIERVIDFNPSDVIDMISPRPLMLIANGGYDQNHFLTHITEAYERAGYPKQLVILPYDVAGLYEEPGRAEALSHAIPFLKEHL